MDKKIKVAQDIMKCLDEFSCEETAAILGIVKLELIKKLIDAEVKRIHINAFKSSYPPELWKALQEEFPFLKSY